MRHNEILIRYGELSLKKKNKFSFINKLKDNIEKIGQIKVDRYSLDRMFVKYSKNNINQLKKIFGIYSFSPVITVESDINKIRDKLKQYLEDIKSKENISTFRITVKRHWKQFKYTSQELNKLFGHFILKDFKKTKVSLKKFDINLEIEIHKNASYIFSTRVKGLGGLPVGINGRSIHLLSGGIDSPVAAVKMMKRGIKVILINFISPPSTDQLTREKVKKITKILATFQGKTKLLQINITEILNLISLIPNQSYKIILLRRSFYRLAEQIASIYKSNIISNGDNLGQVASQTPKSIAVIQNAISVPILRPLLSMDKEEIIMESKGMNIYEISITPAKETCELFAPKNPVIHPDLKTTQSLEKNIKKVFALEKKIIKKRLWDETSF